MSRIHIERAARRANITIHTARPGIVIGKKGEDIEKLRTAVAKILGMTMQDVRLNIAEIRKPELDAKLVAEGISQQLEKRVMFRRAMKRAVTNTMRSGALGIKVRISGRLNGSEIARTETNREGRVPLHTFRADIDYGLAEAQTTYGVIGIKVWIFKGEVFDQPEAEAPRPKPRPRPRRRARSPPKPRRPRKVECQVITHDAAEADQVPQTIQGPDLGQRAARQLRRVRRVRPQGHRPRRMTAREIEAARRAISRYVKRGGRIWIRVFPDVPITQKPLEVRMGSGKGNVEYWVAKVLPGKVLFEIEGMSEEIAREAFRLASAKLSVSTAFVKAGRGAHMKAKDLRGKAPARSARSCSSCAANNSICAWRAPPARRPSRTSSRRSARTSRA